MKRKDFVIKLVKGSTLIAAVPLMLQSCEEDDTTDGLDNDGDDMEDDDDLIIDLSDSKYSALNSDGGSVIVNNIIIANTGNDNFVALSSICTHSGCTINYSGSNNNFPCPCHGSVFSIDGNVLQGPANAPLKKYTVKKAGENLTIE